MIDTPMDNDQELTEEELFEEISEGVESEAPIEADSVVEETSAETSEEDSPTEQMQLDGSSEGDDNEAKVDEFVEEEFVQSIIESVLFATDRPVSIRTLVEVFRGTNVKKDRIKRSIELLSVELAGATRGVYLEQISGGYQLRTKVDNMKFLKRSVKARPFKLSGPALEVLSVIAYKQPVIKSEIDDIRGVDSGHLVRALMDRSIVCFAGKSELPGRPMQYATSRKFLELFGLRNINELPSLSEIDEILPEGINEVEDEITLNQLTGKLSEGIVDSYSEGEEELEKITSRLSEINTSAEFFEQEKLRQRQERDRNRANDIEEALAVGEEVEASDSKWLEKYRFKIEQEQAAVLAASEGVEASEDHTEVIADSEGSLDDAALIAAEDTEGDVAVIATDAVEDDATMIVAEDTEDNVTVITAEDVEDDVAVIATGDLEDNNAAVIVADDVEDDVAVIATEDTEDDASADVVDVPQQEPEAEFGVESMSADEFAEAEVAQAILDFEKDDDDEGFDN